MNRLGIGIVPIGHHHIHIESANPRILIRSTGTNASKILFGDNSSNDPGVIEYAHSENSMRFNTGNTEKLRIGSLGQIGLSGANYGSSGQVLTSQGSGSAVTWSTITGTTINNNANNRIITGSGSANTLEGEANFTFDGTSFTVGASGNSWNTITRGDQTHYSGFHFNDSGSSRAYLGVSGATNHIITGSAQHDVALRSQSNLLFATGGPTERLRIASDGLSLIHI